MIWYRIPLRPVTKKNSQKIIRVNGRLMITPSPQYRRYEKEAGSWPLQTMSSFSWKGISTSKP